MSMLKKVPSNVPFEINKNLCTWIGLTYIGTGKEIADMMTKSRIALVLRSERVVERGKVSFREKFPPLNS